MKIRSITAFCAPQRQLSAAIARLAPFASAAKTAFESAGYEVQTLRVATTPFVHWVKPLTLSRAVEAAVAAEKLIREHSFGYISLGPALPDLPEAYRFIPPMLEATQAVFASAVVAERERGIRMDAVRSAADIVTKASTLETNGFTNLRFAALANVPGGSPFFPAAYNAGERPGFAIATQAADLAVEAFSEAHSIEEGSRKLSAQLELHGKQLSNVAAKLATRFKLEFGGIDFSFAPFPSEHESLGTAMERLGVAQVGMQGSLAAAAILTQAIDAARFKRTGFNGLLLPPLEDYTLAKRVSESALSVNDLLMYSAVCGTGLDTIPVAGDTPAEHIAAVLLDLAALALRLDKPLTARLMPIPGKAAGEMTSFDFPFFANTRIMALRAAGLGGPLRETETIKLAKRISRRAK
jgi:uncharacterized protein (UPF0210 family)